MQEIKGNITPQKKEWNWKIVAPLGILAALGMFALGAVSRPKIDKVRARIAAGRQAKKGTKAGAKTA